MSKHKNTRNSEPYIRLARRLLLSSDEWKGLCSSAKLLYLYLKAKYNGSNNGKIKLAYHELRGVHGLSSPSTISAAQAQLRERGWITIEFFGGIRRHSNLYGLTGKFDDLL